MNEETWSMIVGLLVMLATSLVKNPRWTVMQKNLLFGAVSVVAAVGQLAAEGELEFDGNLWQSLVTRFGVIVATATMIYNLYFRDTAVNAKLEETKIL